MALGMLTSVPQWWREEWRRYRFSFFDPANVYPLAISLNHLQDLFRGTHSLKVLSGGSSLHQGQRPLRTKTAGDLPCPAPQTPPPSPKRLHGAHRIRGPSTAVPARG